MGDKLRVLEVFSGYGSQSMSLRDIGVDHEVVGISEIEPDAIIAYGSIRFNLEDLHTDKTYDEMRSELIAKNVGKDFKTGKSRIPRMKKDKLEMLYKFDKAANNFGDVSIINPEKLPDFDYMTYSFPCFIEGTKILTVDGFKNIENLNCNDYVLTHNNRYKKVVKPMINKADHIYKLSTMASDDLFVTEEHPFYVRERYREWDSNEHKYFRKFKKPQWVKVKDLNKDYYVGIAINQKSELPKWDGVTFKWSDGRSDRHSNVLQDKFKYGEFWWIIGRYLGDGWIRHQGGIIICCDFNETNEITDKLDAIGFNYSISKERTTNKIHIAFKEIGEYVEQFGRGAKNKHLTGDILNLPKELLKYFLDGYMSADGCVTQGLNKASSISNELIYGIGQCVAKVYNRPFSVYKNTRSKTHTIEGRLVNQNDSYSITWKDDVHKQDKAFFEDGYIWCPINNIARMDYEGLVYNIEVEDDNSYVVQNIICHNCTDISVSGKQEGIERGQTRSGLLYECEKIIEVKRPKYLLMENVKNLVGKKFRKQFDEWCKYLEELGYTNYHNNYKCLNAKDFGIAQNRERIFMWSVLGEHKEYEFPKGEKLTKKLKDFLDKDVEEKYYLSEEIQKRFKQTKVDDGSESNSLGAPVATDYKQPKQIIDYPKLVGGFGEINFGKQYRQGNRVYDSEGIAMCLTAQPLGNTGGNSYLYKVDYLNGAIRGRYNENGDIEQQLELRDDGVTNTITSVQKDNVVVINERETFKYEPSGENVIGQMCGDLWERRHEQTRRVYDVETVSPTMPTCSGGGQHPKILEHNTVCEQRCDEGLRFFKDNICGTVRTIDAGGDKRIIETIPSFRIRKITPREALRLMGVSENDIDKMQSVGLSDSSLYKLAGNSIVKQCLDALHTNMFLENK